MRRSVLSIPAALAAILVLAAPAAHAQTDLDRWDAPVAAETVLSLPGGGTVDGDTLYLPLGEQVELRVSARDQFGRAFPQQRLRFEFDFERDCNGLVELVDASDHGVTLRTGKGAGSCSVLLWLPNNSNTDRRLRIVGSRDGGSGVVARPVTGAIDTREELVAASLFRAVLGREPDADWLAGAAEQVRRNETRDQIRSLLGSPEFSSRRRETAPETLLRDIYHGLLAREPDAAGQRTYLGDIRQGDFEEVILTILSSSEFRQRLEREIG